MRRTKWARPSEWIAIAVWIVGIALLWLYWPQVALGATLAFTLMPATLWLLWKIG